MSASLDDIGIDPDELERRSQFHDGCDTFAGDFNTMRSFSPVWARGRLPVIVESAMGQEWIDECYDAEKLCSWYSARGDGQPAAAYCYGGYFKAGFGNSVKVLWSRPLLLEASRVEPAAVVDAITTVVPYGDILSRLPSREVAVGERIDAEVARDWMVENLCHENTKQLWRERKKK